MKSTWTLPEGYGQKYLIDLKDNKKQFWIVNGLSIAIMLALVALFFQLLWYGFLELHFEGLPIQALVMAVGMLAYIPLHELVHGVCIRRFSGKKADYGFTLVYAYAGSACYFTRRDHRVITLAPVTFWGVVFLLLMFLLPVNWRWVAYVLEMSNLAGAAGDFYVFWRLGKEPDTILCQDTGVKMTVFDRL
jgi:hypothetical protein